MMKSQHICLLTSTSVASNFPPLHPKRHCCDIFIRGLRKYLILDVNNMKCQNFFPNNKTMRIELRRNIASPNRFIIHPFSKANGVLEIIFFALIIVRYVTLAIKVGKWFEGIELAVNILWLFFMLTFFLTGFINNHTKEIHIDPKDIAWQYIKTYFIFDLILLGKTPVRYLTTGKTSQSFLRSLTVISYVVRFRTVLYMLNNILMYFGTKKPLAFFIYHFLKLACILHLVTCSYLIMPYFILPHHPQDWLTNWSGRLCSRSCIYTDNFLLVVCYFFGAGYELDRIPTPSENAVLFLISFIGRLYTLELIAKVLHVFGYTNVSESEFELQMTLLKAYMYSKRVPAKTQNRIVASYEYQTGKRHFNEKEMMATLTEQLRTELYLFGARTLIKNHPALNSLSNAVLIDLFSKMESRVYLPGDVFIRVGEQLKHIYFVSSGSVAGYNELGERVLQVERGGELGMTSWLIYKQPQSVLTWVALETSELYRGTREMFGKFFDVHPKQAKYFEKKMKGRVDRFKDEKSGVWKKEDRDVLSSLRSGGVLEVPKKRIFAFE